MEGRKEEGRKEGRKEGGRKEGRKKDGRKEGRKEGMRKRKRHHHSPFIPPCQPLCWSIVSSTSLTQSFPSFPGVSAVCGSDVAIDALFLILLMMTSRPADAPIETMCVLHVCRRPNDAAVGPHARDPMRRQRVMRSSKAPPLERPSVVLAISF